MIKFIQLMHPKGGNKENQMKNKHDNQKVNNKQTKHISSADIFPAATVDCYLHVLRI